MSETTLEKFASNLLKYYFDEECPVDSQYFDYVECPYYGEDWCYGRSKDCIKFIAENLKKIVDDKN